MSSREYFNSILGTYLKNNGIVHQSTCVKTQQQNGIAKWKNRHLLEVVCVIMFTNNVPKLFWGEVIVTASYLINCLPSRVLQFQTPLQILLQTHPHTLLIQNLPIKTFGCTVFAHDSLIPSLIPKPQNAFSSDIHHAKKNTTATVLKLENCLLPGMLLSLRTNHTIQILLFRGRT